MNHDCHGDIFERWGKLRGRCLADGSFFDYEDGLEFCPNCKRPWLGIFVDKQDQKHRYKPDEDSAVLREIDLPHFKRVAEERGRKITHLEEKLNLWQGMYYKAAGMEYMASLHGTTERGG